MTLAYRVECFLSLPLDPLLTLSSSHFTQGKITSECDVTFEQYSSKKYALNKVYELNKMHVLNKQVSNYVVLPFFSNNSSIVTFVLTGYGFMLPYMCFIHLALLDHSMPDCARHSQSVAWC